MVPSSSEEKPKAGVGSFVAPDGPESIVVLGGVLSTSKARWAGEASVFPAGSMARTWKVCGPSPSDAVVWAEVQETQASLSVRHSKVEPAWSDENVNVGVGSFVGPEGPLSIVVSGVAVSTVNARDAGVGSTFPAGSVARTSKVCAPSASDAVVTGVEHEPHTPPSTRHSKVEPA